MVQKKFENEIKQKLSSREINPSEKAWDRLDAMLSVAEKPKRNYNWLFVAATFLGFTLIGIVMFNLENTITDNSGQTVVITESPETETEKIDDYSIENDIFIIENEVETVAVASKKPIKAEENTINTQTEFVSDELENIQEQIVLQTEEPKIAKYIDAKTLLAEVEGNKEKTPVMISQKSSVKINANELLSSTENEINETFRDKVLQSINKNFNAVKSALANRNNE
ncbi:MAG: hypothetical protein RBR78_04950 [Flavobacteriaceae bacterium]|jgi:hypothetical protein|nr:hypothetical protein [Flavobacteriaceae bacterium]